MEAIMFSDMMENQMRHVPLRRPTKQRRTSTMKTSSTRRKLADWMLSITEDFKCDQEVFSAAVTYLDRYLAMRQGNKEDLYLLGAVCVVVACKMFSRGTIHLRSLCAAQDHMFTPIAIKRQELALLNQLKWDLDTPKPHDFLHMFLKGITLTMDDDLRHMVQRHADVIVDMCYTDASLVPFGPAVIAATSLYFAIRENGRVHYSKSDLETYYGLLSHFGEAQQTLLPECIRKAENLMVVYDEEPLEEGADDDQAAEEDVPVTVPSGEGGKICQPVA